MFLNCGEFVEINSGLFATYLFNDLSKINTNVLQITKFHKNHKKFLNARAGHTAGRMQIFFFAVHRFSVEKWKICGSVDFFIFTYQCFVGIIWTHTFQKGLCKNG